MKKYLMYIISIILIFILVLMNVFKKEEYSQNLFYMDTYISVKFSTRNKIKAKKILNEIDETFKYYHNLTDRYDSNSEINKINNKIGQFEINKDLYQILEYSLDFYNKSNQLFNINLGNLIDVWKKYRDFKTGIPTLEELNVNIDINNIKLLGNNKVSVNNANIDLGSVTKGYVTKVIGEYLNQNKIKDFIINAGGNVIVGNRKPYYKIGIEDANDTSNIIEVVKGNNICVVTSGGYRRFYSYDGVIYHHIIDPSTKFPPNYMKSVTVITDNCALGDIMSTILFLMPIEDGKEFIENYDVEVIWYDNNNNIIKSKGISKYE